MKSLQSKFIVGVIRRLSCGENLSKVSSYYKKHGLKNTIEKTKSVVVSRSLARSQRFQAGNFYPIAPSFREKSHREIRVATIMDEFSENSWSDEFTIVPLKREGLSEQLLETDGTPAVDFLFVESAWNGNGGDWQYQLTGPKAPSDSIRAVIEVCNANEIPTAFWNKEDPPHFEDFLDTAKLFDVVFTTALEKVEEYRKELDHNRIFVLPFAAQESIHNPIRNNWERRDGDINFAGMYFAHKFPERREQIDLLVGAAVDVTPKLGNGLTIYSRYAGEDERYQFPLKYQDFIHGSLPYTKMLAAYRKFKVTLNVNSVTDSETMCSRRVFEAAASGSCVVSTPSKALQYFFSEDEVPRPKTKQEAKNLLRALVQSSEFRDRIVHRAQRKIWENHTYRNRADFLVEVLLGKTTKGKKELISVISSTNRPSQIPQLIEQICNQQNVEVELLLMVHGDGQCPEETKSLKPKGCIREIKLFRAPSSESLGNCLNTLVEHATGNFVAKIDDDDIYCPNYLRDQLNACRFSGADLVGKQAVYVNLVQRNLLALKSPNSEHRWTDFVAGPTLFGPAQTFREVKFQDRTLGEDSGFLTDLKRQGKKIYSTDRFNFVQVRHGDSHTWSIDDLEILANSEVKLHGPVGDIGRV